MPDGSKCYMSPAGVWFERVGREDGWIIMKHLKEGWIWRITITDFLNKWKCG